MNPRYAFFFKLLGAICLIVLLAVLFPPILKFVELAGRELRYFWWLVFIVLIAGWLIWGLGAKKK
ncbi:MAG: hypothetical protein P4M10_00690 [Verrucomicrobiae bacterium]|nr:hypothetical protein [Verrucomicrobiae bacterium]